MRFRKLSLTPRRRVNLLKMLASDLIYRGSVVLTEPKAKTLRRHLLKLAGLYGRGHVNYVVSQLYGPARGMVDALGNVKVLAKKIGPRIGDGALCMRLTIETRG